MKRAAIAFLVVVGGCQSVPEGARTYISNTHSCPADRVTARALDKKPSELRAELDPQAARAAPPEIAADPARLAMWTKKQAAVDTAGDYQQLVEVTACDAVYVLECHQSRRMYARGWRANGAWWRSNVAWGESSVSCVEMTKRSVK